MSELQGTSSHVDSEVKCIHCEYNLRYAQKEGRCPECGESVKDSTNYRKPPELAAAIYCTAIGWSCVVAAFFFASSLSVVLLLVAFLLNSAALVTSFQPMTADRTGRRGRVVARLSSGAFLILFLVTFGLFLYEMRDTTIYSPQFNKARFGKILPCMTRVEVESLIGQPMRIRNWADDANGRSLLKAAYSDSNGWAPDWSKAVQRTHIAHYTTRGDKGWDYDVIYDEGWKVIRTWAGYDRH